MGEGRIQAVGGGEDGLPVRPVSRDNRAKRTHRIGLQAVSLESGPSLATAPLNLQPPLLPALQERQLRRFKSPRQAQRFLFVHSPINNLFRLRRLLLPARHYRALRTQVFAT